jgi:hypothetical protein
VDGLPSPTFPSENGSMSGSPLAINLTIPNGPHPVGAIVPIHVEVRNISSAELWIVGVLDGSEMGFRFPHYLPTVISPQPLPPLESEGCGNVAPLRLQDFRRLAPGESFDPTVAESGAGYLPIYAFANFSPTFAGHFELRLTLSTESEKPEDWLGMLGYPGEEEVLERLKAVPRVRVESNVAVIHVS